MKKVESGELKEEDQVLSWSLCAKPMVGSIQGQENASNTTGSPGRSLNRKLAYASE
jgi:hypothetical protein